MKSKAERVITTNTVNELLEETRLRLEDIIEADGKYLTEESTFLEMKKLEKTLNKIRSSHIFHKWITKK